MTTIITIIVLIGAVIVLTLIMLAFAYPNLLVRAGKFLFVRPVKALVKVGHHKPAPLAVKAGEIKTDIPHVK